MVPLARAFVAAGHTVHWAASGDAGRLVTAAGIDAVPAGLDGPGAADAQRRLRAALTTVRPQEKAAFAFPTMFGEWATPPMVRDLLPLARDLQPDLLVHEAAEHAAPLVGALLGVPSVTHAFGGAVPPAFLVETGERLGWLWSEHGLTTPPYAGAFTATYLDICPPAVQTVPVDHIPTRQPLRPVTYSRRAGAAARRGRRGRPAPARLPDAGHRPQRGAGAPGSRRGPSPTSAPGCWSRSVRTATRPRSVRCPTTSPSRAGSTRPTSCRTARPSSPTAGPAPSSARSAWGCRSCACRRRPTSSATRRPRSAPAPGWRSPRTPRPPRRCATRCGASCSRTPSAAPRPAWPTRSGPCPAPRRSSRCWSGWWLDRR